MQKLYNLNYVNFANTFQDYGNTFNQEEIENGQTQQIIQTRKYNKTYTGLTNPETVDDKNVDEYISSNYYNLFGDIFRNLRYFPTILDATNAITFLITGKNFLNFSNEKNEMNLQPDIEQPDIEQPEKEELFKIPNYFEPVYDNTFKDKLKSIISSLVANPSQKIIIYELLSYVGNYLNKIGNDKVYIERQEYKMSKLKGIKSFQRIGQGFQQMKDLPTDYLAYMETLEKVNSPSFIYYTRAIINNILPTLPKVAELITTTNIYNQVYKQKYIDKEIEKQQSEYDSNRKIIQEIEKSRVTIQQDIINLNTDILKKDDDIGLLSGVIKNNEGDIKANESLLKQYEEKLDTLKKSFDENLNEKNLLESNIKELKNQITVTRNESVKSEKEIANIKNELVKIQKDLKETYGKFFNILKILQPDVSDEDMEKKINELVVNNNISFIGDTLESKYKNIEEEYEKTNETLKEIISSLTSDVSIKIISKGVGETNAKLSVYLIEQGRVKINEAIEENEMIKNYAEIIGYNNDVAVILKEFIGTEDFEKIRNYISGKIKKPLVDFLFYENVTDLRKKQFDELIEQSENKDYYHKYFKKDLITFASILNYMQDYAEMKDTEQAQWRNIQTEIYELFQKKKSVENMKKNHELLLKQYSETNEINNELTSSLNEKQIIYENVNIKLNEYKNKQQELHQKHDSFTENLQLVEQEINKLNDDKDVGENQLININDILNKQISDQTQLKLEKLNSQRSVIFKQNEIAVKQNELTEKVYMQKIVEDNFKILMQQRESLQKNNEQNQKIMKQLEDNYKNLYSHDLKRKEKAKYQKQLFDSFYDQGNKINDNIENEQKNNIQLLSQVRKNNQIFQQFGR